MITLIHKIKMSKKPHSAVVLSESSSLFVKISICDALLPPDLFNDVMHFMQLK